MIKLRVETVVKDGRPTFPGRNQFQESVRRNRLERGCQGTGSIVENQIRQPLHLVFSLVGPGRIQYIPSIGLFYKNKTRDGGGLSYCKELVGATHRR